MTNNKLPDQAYSRDTYYRYNTGKYYADTALDARFYPYMFDGWTDRRQYGLKNKSGNAIYPNPGAMQIYKNDNGVLQSNVVFVADAFAALKEYYKSIIRTDKLEKTSRLYVEPIAASTAVELDDLYIPHIQSLYNVFAKTYLRDVDRKNIKDIDSFLQFFIPFLSRILYLYPINRSSFITSQYCPLELSGLTISLLTTPEYNNTKAKLETYIGDPNFGTFLEVAGRYGFMVDKNNPWRIIADLNSPAMADYYSVYGYRNVDEVHNKLYFKAYEGDLQTLKNVLIALWNTYSSNNRLVIKKDYIANCDAMFASVKINSGVDSATFDRYYNNNWLVRLYAYTKAHEYGADISQQRFEALYQNALQYFQVSREQALGYIDNSLLNFKKITASANEDLTDVESVVRLLQEQKQLLPAEGLIF